MTLEDSSPFRPQPPFSRPPVFAKASTGRPVRPNGSISGLPSKANSSSEWGTASFATKSRSEPEKQLPAVEKPADPDRQQDARDGNRHRSKSHRQGIEPF